MSKEKYSAIIIEPRKHDAFKLVLDNFLTHLDDRWDIIIFHGNTNKTYLENLIDDEFAIYKKRINMVHMNVDNLSYFDYNRILRCKMLYERIPTEMFLVFQLDTLISDVYYEKIYDFMDFDYVGAPWPLYYPNLVGNGGLSLRRKSKMLEVIDNLHVPENMNEDLYYTSYKRLHKPSHEDAKDFSVECIYYDKSFGIHQCWKFMTNEQMQEIAKHIPKIFELQEIYSKYEAGSPAMTITDINGIFRTDS
jgi:hypothetical protein